MLIFLEILNKIQTYNVQNKTDGVTAACLISAMKKPKN